MEVQATTQVVKFNAQTVGGEQKISNAPASNAATVTSLWKIIGGKSTLGYIFSIVITCWVMAIIIDTTGISLLVTESMHHHDMGISLFQHLSAGVLVALLAVAKIR